MNYPKAHEGVSKLITPEFAEIMADREEIGSKANIARLIYEERQMAESSNDPPPVVTSSSLNASGKYKTKRS